MFYSQSLLSKNGALGNIWMAAYCFKKLKKQQIADTDITSSIEKIMPEVQISYRVLGQLLFGIVKIYSKKVDYLYHDCNEALTNIIRSFNPRQHTMQRKSNIGPQNAQKKENRVRQDDAVVAKEVAHAPEQNVSISKNGTPTALMEAMLASYHDVTITLPERFELDAFDLEVADEGDAGKPNEESFVGDGRLNDKDQFSQNECHNKDLDAPFMYNSGLFTPMDDAILSMTMDPRISELYNLVTIESRGETIEGLQSIEESKNHEGCLHDEHIEDQVHSVNLQDKIISDVQRDVQNDKPNQVEPCNLCSTKPTQCEESRDPTEQTSNARNQDEGNSKSNIPSGSGIPSPKFAVATPAKREVRRVSRKRKIHFDDRIVLSNDTMRNLIHDASDLVCKRRKAPHTSLDAWKSYRFANPLIPYVSPEHKNILLKKPSDWSPQKKPTSSSEISNKSGDSDNSFQGKIPTDVNHSDISTPDRSEVRMSESSPIEILASDLDMIDKEVSFTEKESGMHDGGWSVRTREVARYLLDKFVDLKQHKRTETLNLAQILEGQKRAKSARIFYETLSLKGHGCIDVKQDSPYDNIILLPTPKLEALFDKQ